MGSNAGVIQRLECHSSKVDVTGSNPVTCFRTLHTTYICKYTVEIRMNTCMVCRTETSNKKFCSRSCSAKHTNKTAVKRKKIRVDYTLTCMFCDTTFQTQNQSRKYCSSLCHGAELKRKKHSQIESGIPASTRNTHKRYLSDTIGHYCFECRLTEWRGKPVSLELDHINGDASDDSLSNLRLLCPNCHSQTPTWKGANVGSGRKARGISLG